MMPGVERIQLILKAGEQWLVYKDQWIVLGLGLLLLLWILSEYQRWLPWCVRHTILTDLLLILGCSIFILAPLAQPGAPGGHDIYFHLSRVAELNRLFQDGYYYGRWGPDFNYGFGYPLFNFYPSLIYYLAQPFRILGLGTFDALKLVIVSGVWLSGLFMYLFGKEFWGRHGGVVCAVAYMYIPYRMVNLYVRGAIPEFYAMTFMPLIFWSFYKIVHTQKLKYVLIGAISYGLMIPSHNVTAVFFTLCLMAYSLFLLLEMRLAAGTKWKQIITTGVYLICTAALGAGLLGRYWLPAMYEKQFVRISSLHSGYHDVAVHFVYFSQFFSRFWGYGGSGKELRDGMSFQLGIEHLLIAALSLLVVFLLQRKYPRHRNHCIFFLLLFGSLMFAMTSGSLPIWRTFPLIGFISFPWRLLSLTGFVLSFLCGGIFLIDFDTWQRGRFMLSYKKRLTAFSVIGVILFFTVDYCRVSSPEPMPLPEQAFSSESLRRSPGAAMNGEYLPVWVDTSLKKLEEIKGGEVRIKSGDALIGDDIRTDMLSYQFTVEAKTASVLQVGTVYFPGWKAYDNDVPLPLEPDKTNGLLTMNIAPGPHHITVRFEDTVVRTLGQYISLGSLGIVCGLIVLHLIRRK